MLSYHRETALQGALVLAKAKDWNWETIFYGQSTRLVVTFLLTEPTTL